MSDAVLVLNANYEPINVCGIHRAIGLILTDRANLVLNGRGEYHSTTVAIPIPSVIRLQNMVSRPRQQVKLTRKEVFRRDNFTCQYCGRRNISLTIDHVIPRRLGGKHIWTNVVAACSACNHKKGGRTLREVNMRPLSQPHLPSNSAQYVFGHHVKEYMEWEPFLKGW